jgi:urate oxidase
MCTELEANWSYNLSSDAQIRAHNFVTSDAAILRTMLDVWSGPPVVGRMSNSVQETAYRMGGEVLRRQPTVDVVRIYTPNIHHYRWEAEKFGMSNANVVFQSTDCHTSASGRIETVMKRPTRSRL